MTVEDFSYSCYGAGGDSIYNTLAIWLTTDGFNRQEFNVYLMKLYIMI